VAQVRLTIRSGSRVEHERFGSLEEALDALVARGRQLQRDARAKPIDTKVLGRFEPAQQVVARLSVRGAGVDVHGDGSAVAFTGRVRRRQLDGDDAYDALRSTLGA
jgi:hypothetical protein